jgi:toxin ParE1/3/4
VKVRYLPKALGQLAEILATIEAENPKAAAKVATRIHRSVERVAAFPFSSRATSHPGVRVLPTLPYPYLVFYEVDERAQEVRILRVRHMARNPKRHLD